MNLTHFVDHPRVEKDSLRERGLASVDVRGNADIPRPL
jgi:hypothetical protein